MADCFRPDLPDIPCPVWQCGGTLKPQVAKYSKETEKAIGDQIDWQIPEMECDDCHTVYRAVKIRQNDGRIVPLKEKLPRRA